MPLSSDAHVKLGIYDRELAWAAGFFDGEGNTYCGRIAKAKKKPYHTDPCFVSLSIAQNEVAPLIRFRDAVKLGVVCGPYHAKRETKPHYQWRIASQDGVRTVLRNLWPYLSEPKRRQALNALDRLNKYLDEPRGRWAYRQEVRPK